MSWSFLTRKFKIRQKIAPWNLSGSLVVLIISPKPWRTWNLRNRQLRKVIPGKKNPKLGSSSWGRTTNSGGFVWQFLKKSKDFFCETYQHFHPKTPVVWSQKFQEDFSKTRFSKHRAFWASENLANAFNVFFGDDVRTLGAGEKRQKLWRWTSKWIFFVIWGLFWCFGKNPKCSSPNSELISMVLNLQSYNTNPPGVSSVAKYGWKVSSESKLGQPQQNATSWFRGPVALRIGSWIYGF